jgi:hypothetical protein
MTHCGLANALSPMRGGVINEENVIYAVGVI